VILTPEKPLELDEKDWALIEALKKNAQLSEQKLAKLTGIAMSTVHHRLRKLKESGVIEKYTLKLDYAKVGKPLVAFVMLKAINQADQLELFEKVKKMPEVYEVALITGEFDLIFMARAASMDELNKIVLRDIRKQRHIGESRTMICYEHFERP